MWEMIIIVGYRNVKLKFLFVIFISMIVVIVLCIGWVNNFIVRLENVRFKNKFFKLEGIDDIFYRV